MSAITRAQPRGVLGVLDPQSNDEILYQRWKFIELCWPTILYRLAQYCTNTQMHNIVEIWSKVSIESCSRIIILLYKPAGCCNLTSYFWAQCNDGITGVIRAVICRDNSSTHYIKIYWSIARWTENRRRTIPVYVGLRRQGRGVEPAVA